jgi:hypothetical protein
MMSISWRLMREFYSIDKGRFDEARVVASVVRLLADDGFGQNWLMHSGEGDWSIDYAIVTSSYSMQSGCRTASWTRSSSRLRPQLGSGPVRRASVGCLTSLCTSAAIGGTSSTKIRTYPSGLASATAARRVMSASSCSARGLQRERPERSELDQAVCASLGAGQRLQAIQQVDDLSRFAPGELQPGHHQMFAFTRV